MPDATVIVVGGGASGLSAAAALKQAGIHAVVFERDSEIGGTWSRRYDRLHLHTVRGFSGLAHYAIPRRYPRYLARNDFVAYLRDYAEHFGLRVIKPCEVTKIARDDSESRWRVETSDGDRWNAAAVIVATGQYRVPFTPAWPGTETFRGELSHSAAYSNAKPYVGKRVLVVGAGNSGAEIATDIAENGGKLVALSIRTAPAIVPRDPFGMPIQRTGIMLSVLPAGIADRIGRLTSRIVLGDLTRYQIPKPRWGPFSARRVPLIDVGFVSAVRRGLVQIRPALERLTPTGVGYADRREEQFDAIVAATGFATGLENLIDDVGVLNEAGEPIAPSGNATAQPGLYFMGFVHSLRGHLFEANRASRRLAKNLQGYLAASAARQP